MMRALAVLLVAALLGAPALADTVTPVLANGFIDEQGDAPTGLDLHDVYWLQTDSDVTVGLDSALADGAALTAILFTGVEGAVEPLQAYILHHGPEGDRILTTENSTATLDVRVDNATVYFDISDVLDAGCTFAVARTVTYHEGGQQIEDVVGWTDGAIEDAWDEGSGCTDERRPSSGGIDEDGKGIPGVGAAPLAFLLAALAWSRRRNA